MKKTFWVALVVAFALMGMAPELCAGEADVPKRGEQAAKALSMVTGAAVSPLLGVSAVGAYEYFKSNEKESLPWYAKPLFWIPALLLVGAVATKDSLGAVLPPGWKKPLDAAEVIENKVSGLVMGGAFVPIVASIFSGSPGGGSAQATEAATQLAGVGFSGPILAAFSPVSLLNIFVVPLAIAAFVLVWLVSHAINILILISPWGAVDAALKSFRVFLMSLVYGTSFANPIAGAVLSIIVIVIAYFLAGWSFRLTVFGSIYAWDILTGRRKRFTPSQDANWMFTADEIDKAPVRTYGKLTRTESGQLLFEYRPWLFLQKSTLTLPSGTYVVGRGLFYPEIISVDGAGERVKTFLLLPPRFRTHEEAVVQIYKLCGVKDVGLLKGFKAAWNWLKGMFGRRRRADLSTQPA